MTEEHISEPLSGGSAMSVDAADLAALSDSIESMLGEVCTSLAIHEYLDGNNDLDVIVWQQAKELGFFGVGLPEQYDGLGLGSAGLNVLYRQLGRFVVPGAFLPTLVGAQWLLRAGNEEQKNQYLPRVAMGDLKIAIPATVTPEYAGGSVHRILGAADSDLAIAPVEGGWQLIELEGQQAMVEMWDKTQPVFTLDSSSVKSTSTIGDADGSLGQLLSHYFCLAVASDSLGGAQAISDQTVEYLKTREQFGQPIGAFQALKHRMADQYALLTTNEYLLEQAIDAMTQDLPDAYLWAAQAKAGASDAYAFISGDCVQLHGGVGFTQEFDCHIFLKRARLNEMLVAVNSVMRDQAAEHLIVASHAGRSTTELPAV